MVWGAGVVGVKTRLVAWFRGGRKPGRGNEGVEIFLWVVNL